MKETALFLMVEQGFTYKCTICYHTHKQTQYTYICMYAHLHIDVIYNAHK
jgi:hypothetical protein